MFVFNYDKTICCRFLLAAGDAASNTTLLTAFTQVRSPSLDKFVTAFNQRTSHLPGDLLLPTVVWVPFASAKASTPFFIIKAPRTYGLFKKITEVRALGDGYFLEFNLLNLFKIALVKASTIQAVNKLRALFFYFFSFVGTVSSGKVWSNSNASMFYYFYLPLGSRGVYSLRWF